MSFAQSYTEIQNRIAAACTKAKRQPSSVHLLAVSKTQPIEAIVEAYNLGVRHFGENYVQELLEKKQALSHLKGIYWHLIGPLQSNKAAVAVKCFDYFHALDSEKIFKELEKKAATSKLEKKLPVFVQVNVDDQSTKSGATADEAKNLCEAVEKSSVFTLAGLMCIPQPKSPAEQMRPAFNQMSLLATEIQNKLSLKHSLQLSMGMSEDFEVAIEAGANWVRVGRALFGERKSKK